MDLLPSEEQAIDTLKKTAIYFNISTPPYDPEDFRINNLEKSKAVIVIVLGDN